MRLATLVNLAASKFEISNLTPPLALNCDPQTGQIGPELPNTLTQIAPPYVPTYDPRPLPCRPSAA